LVQHDVAGPTAETTRSPKRIRVTLGSHGGYDEGAQAGVEFVRGRHRTGSCLLNLTALRGIEIYQKHVATTDALGGHHVHSVYRNE
jgi:hypothetical protein